MLAITITVNVIWIALLGVFSVLTGFVFRSAQIYKLKKQVSSLEREMLNNHAEILHLQEEMVRAQSKGTNPKTLVVAMKDVPSAEESNELLSDARKVK
jgi:hypothetical protein